MASRLYFFRYLEVGGDVAVCAFYLLTWHRDRLMWDGIGEGGAGWGKEEGKQMSNAPSVL